jgi:hypothetical protein
MRQADAVALDDDVDAVHGRVSEQEDIDPPARRP